MTLGGEKKKGTFCLVEEQLHVTPSGYLLQTIFYHFSSFNLSHLSFWEPVSSGQSVALLGVAVLVLEPTQKVGNASLN